MRNSEEALLRKIRESNVVDISEALDPKEYKMMKQRRRRMNGSRKECMGSM